MKTETTPTSYQTKNLIIRISTTEKKYHYHELPSKRTHNNKKGKKPDQVNHLGLDNSDWTKRVKSHELYQHVH